MIAATGIVTNQINGGNKLSREDLAQVDGLIMDVLAGGNFTVQLPNGQKISAKLSGRMRKFHIRVILGDRVTVGVSPYDLTHGLILHRHKAGQSSTPGTSY
ncbi:MAG: translation initiation factor IF-1 [Bdellovibrionia bacterium]